MTEEQNNNLEQHPVNLIAVHLIELFIRAYHPPNPALEINEQTVSIGVGIGDYDEEDNVIGVAIKLESTMKDEEGEIDDETPYSLKIILEGVFRVTDDSVSIEQIQRWAENAAPYVLFPYLREQAYALTSRMGFKPLILPLIQVPTSI